ncbi:MAG: DUF4912 domain-containing protein [Hydrogenothermaceae bacterium]|nr:DUF4912 domain-containing protein [Hydrogenothermaceae bacterium]
MANPIVEMSFLEDDLSSHINKAPEELKMGFLREFSIPERYDVDRFTILPVNPHLIYSYWFTKDSLKEDIKSRFGDFSVCLRLLINNEIIKEVEVKSLEGEYYLHYHAPFQKVKAVLGIVKNGEFIPILYSNEVVMPSDTIFIEEDQHWYDRKSGLVRVMKSDTEYIDEFNKILKENSGVSLKGYHWRR